MLSGERLGKEEGEVGVWGRKEGDRGSGTGQKTPAAAPPSQLLNSNSHPHPHPHPSQRPGRGQTAPRGGRKGWDPSLGFLASSVLVSPAPSLQRESPGTIPPPSETAPPQESLQSPALVNANFLPPCPLSLI